MHTMIGDEIDTTTGEKSVPAQLKERFMQSGIINDDGKRQHDWLDIPAIAAGLEKASKGELTTTRKFVLGLIAEPGVALSSRMRLVELLDSIDDEIANRDV